MADIHWARLTQPHPPCILIVDADDDRRDFYTAVVDQLGYHAHACANNATALAQLIKQRYDLIIADGTLPQTHALTLVQTIRRAGSRIPILMLSGEHAPDTTQTLQSSGATAVLHKPVAVRILVGWIRTCLEQVPPA